MGYWAKDGSYQMEPGDRMERETQKQEFERKQRFLEGMRQEEERKKAAEEARREARVTSKQEEEEYKRVQMEKYNNQLENLRKEENTQKNIAQYGVDINLRNPEDLAERRARANFWRNRNNWCILKNVINGKSKKFEKLWDQFSKSTSEEERLEIVEQMEKMFPTRESAIKSVEKQARGR